jgi:hypothetical protein
MSCAAPHFIKWIDDHQGGPTRPGLAQRGEHPRVIRPRVLSHDEDRVSEREVLERDRAFADPERSAHPRAARLVAEIRTVGQVVGAELAHERLVQKRRLVAGAPRGVERGLVGALESGERLADELERVVVRERRVVRRALSQHHGLGQTSLFVQPKIAPFGELCDAVARKERRIDPRFGGLRSERFRAVFAKLERRTIVHRLRPGAPRTVEAALLVHREQSAGAGGEREMPMHLQRGVHDREHPASHLRGLGEPRRVVLERRLGAVRQRTGRDLRTARGCHGNNSLFHDLSSGRTNRSAPL